jgi:hypothetical protein
LIGAMLAPHQIQNWPDTFVVRELSGIGWSWSSTSWMDDGTGTTAADMAASG